MLAKDENFKTLQNFQLGIIKISSAQICLCLDKLRKAFSISWLIQASKKDNLYNLTQIISTVLFFTENEDTSVKVIACRALGNLLLSITPFNPIVFIKAFGNAVAKDNCKSPIVVINSFVYLSRFISPVLLQKFIITINVEKYFSMDLTDCLKYLPNVVPLMGKIPLIFHKTLIKTLLEKCSKRINLTLTNTIMKTVSLNKNELVKFLKELLIKLNMPTIILALGKVITKDEIMYNLLGEDGKELFLETSLQEFRKEQPGFSEFESACLICLQLLKFEQKTDKYDEINKRIFSSLRKEYPPHFKRLTLLLPEKITDILYLNFDSDSMKAAQLIALSSFYIDRKSDISPDVIAKVFYESRNSTNDLYCSLIESFTKCIQRFLLECKENYHIKLLLFFLNKNNNNWVHDIAISNLINTIDVSICSKFIPSYFDLTSSKLLEFMLSPNIVLHKNAISTLVNIVSYYTIQKLLILLFKGCWLDETIVSRKFELLSNLSKIFNIDFSMFIPIAYECMLFFDTFDVTSNICLFLSNIKVSYIDKNILDYCLNFIIYNFQSYTKMPIEIPDFQFNIPIPATSFLESYDSDIVSNPSFDHETALAPIRNCFNFLCSLPLEFINDKKCFFWVCMHLIPIFDKIALEKAYEINTQFNIDTNALWKFIYHLFKVSSKDSVVATCCKLMVNSPIEIPNKILQIIEKYLVEKINEPDIIYYCFIIIDQTNHEMALNYLEVLIKYLDVNVASVLLFKLSLVIGESVMYQIDKKYDISLLRYANGYGGEYRKRVYEYLMRTSFNDIPLDDQTMNFELASFIQNNNIKIKLPDLNSIDDKHWKFIITNIEIFKTENIVDYISKNQRKFMKMDIKNIYPKLTEKKYEFKKYNTIHLSTITPFLIHGKFYENDSLLKSFMQFSSFEISQEIFEKILNFSLNNSKLLLLTINYAIKKNKRINDDIILQNDIFNNDKIFIKLLKYFKIYGSFEKYPKKIIDFIEKKIGYSNITYDLVSISSNNILVRKLAQNSLNFFLQYFIEVQNFKFNQYVELLKFIQKSEFDTTMLNELLSIHLTNYLNFNTHKKKSLLIRFIAVIIDMLIKKGKTNEIQIITNLFSVNFDVIIEQPYNTLFTELSYILPIILQFNQHKQYGIFLNNLMKSDYCISLFLKSLSLIFINDTTITLKKEYFLELCDSNCPSKLSSLLDSLILIIEQSNHQNVIEIIRECCSNLCGKLPFFSFDFEISSKMSSLIIKLAQFSNQIKLPDFFYQTFVFSFLLNSHYPSYLISLNSIIYLTNNTFDIINYLFNINFTNEKILQVFWELFTQRKLDVKYLNDQICSFFLQNPSVECSQLIIKMTNIAETTESTICFLMNNISHFSSNYLPLFILLSSLLNSKNKETFIPLLNLSKSRQLSFQYFNVDNDKSFLFASINTDNLEIIENEIKLFE